MPRLLDLCDKIKLNGIGSYPHFLQKGDSMAFLPNLQAVREQIVNDANWRTIEAIEALFAKVDVPVEILQKSLLTGAKNMAAVKTRASFYVPLDDLLTYSPPLTLYTGYTHQHTTSMFALRFEKPLQYEMLNRLFRTTGVFLKLDGIRQKLSEAFPDGTLIISICDSPMLSLQFLVEYQLERPLSIVKLQ